MTSYPEGWIETIDVDDTSMTLDVYKDKVIFKKCIGDTFHDIFEFNKYHVKWLGMELLFDKIESIVPETDMGLQQTPDGLKIYKNKTEIFSLTTPQVKWLGKELTRIADRLWFPYKY